MISLDIHTKILKIS